MLASTEYGRSSELVQERTRARMVRGIGGLEREHNQLVRSLRRDEGSILPHARKPVTPGRRPRNQSLPARSALMPCFFCSPLPAPCFLYNASLAPTPSGQNVATCPRFVSRIHCRSTRASRVTRGETVTSRPTPPDQKALV